MAGLLLELCIPTRYLKLCYYREREKTKKFKELKKNLVVRRKKKKKFVLILICFLTTRFH